MANLIAGELALNLAARILELADDELILAHRNSEWCGHAPILEEDIAFANLALDELGHAMLWYRLYAELTDQDPETAPDRLVYFREPFEFRSAQFCALPKGDWAFSMLRQYLWDELEAVRLDAFVKADFGPLAETAALYSEVRWERAPIAFAVENGRGTLAIGAVAEAAVEPYLGPTGEPTTLNESIFSTIPGSPAYVSKASHYRRSGAAYGLRDVELRGHNAMQGDFHFEA